MGVNGSEDGLWRGSTAAEASLSIALPSTTMAAPGDCFLSTIELPVTPFEVKKAFGLNKEESKQDAKLSKE